MAEYPYVPGPEVPDWTTVEQRIQLWMEVTDAAEAFLLAGLRRQVGPDGDLEAAYRKWQAEYNDDHERMLVRMLERMNGMR